MGQRSLKSVPLVTFQSTSIIFEVKNKIQMLFFFSILNQLIFIGQQADVGQERKKGVTGRGYIGGDNCHIHHVVLFDIIILVIILLQKQCRAITRWLFPD